MPNRNLLLSSGKKTISVTLKVINSSGNAIKNARIEIQELGSFTTDNNGKVFLEGLLENEIYRVTISAPGYTSISNRFATNTDPVQEYTFVLQVALPSVETILVTREPEYQSFALTIPNGVTVLKVLSAYFVESSEYIGNMSLHNIDNNWKYKGMVTSLVSTHRYLIIPGYTSVNSDPLEDGENSEYKVLKNPLTVIRLKTDILSKIIIEGKSCDTPERLGETLYLSNVNVHTKEFLFENCRITPRKDLPLLTLTYADHQLTTAKSLINTIVLAYMNKLNYRYNLCLDISKKLYFIELIQKINKHLYRLIGDLISPKILSNCLPDINLEDMLEERLEERLEDRFSRYLYRPCPGKHFFYEVSKELNLISDPTTTELNSSSVISPNGQSIPMYDLLFGKIPGCRVEKLSEYSYQVNVTIPMPESVKIDIRCGNEAPLPPSVFFAQGESIDLRDIAEEIDVPEYTFSQPNYLRDMQDPRDIPDPQDPEPSTEALLGTTLDQLMRYSRLSGYRGDHFVNN